MTAAPCGLEQVTVICPVYNVVGCVPELLERLHSLAARGARVCVVDDGSTDGSRELLARLVASRPSKIRLILQPHNAGVAVARNQALGDVFTEYVWFADSDDTWEPDILDVLVERAESTGADVVVAAAEIVDSRTGARRTIERTADVVVDGVVATRLMLDSTWHGYLWNKLFRVDRNAPLRFPEMRTQSDFVFTFDAMVASTLVASVDRVLYTHVLRAGSVSQSGSIHTNLERCWRHVDDRLRGASTVNESEIEFFRVWFYTSAAAASIWRSSLSAEDKSRALSDVVSAAHWRDVLVARRHSRLVAIRLLVLLTWRGRSGHVVALARSGRRRLGSLHA